MRVYLCGPINGCTDEECKGWREEAKSIFPGAVDPMRRDYRGKEEEFYREIVELDKRDVLSCDALLVNYTKPSVGAAMEILLAWENQIPVVLWCDKSAVISPWLRYHSTRIAHTLSSAAERVREVA